MKVGKVIYNFGSQSSTLSESSSFFYNSDWAESFTGVTRYMGDIPKKRKKKTNLCLEFLKLMHETTK